MAVRGSLTYVHRWRKTRPGWVAPDFDPSTQETEAGGSLSSRPAWSTESVPGQPRLHRETLSEKIKAKQNNNKPYKKNNLSKLRLVTQACSSSSLGD